jgi:hypothetical protein
VTISEVLGLSGREGFHAFFYVCAALVCGTVAAGGATVKCEAKMSDARAIQRAVNRGGTLVIGGSCFVGKASVNINNPIAISGSATLVGNAGVVFRINSDNVSISGLTFVSTGIYVPGASNARRSHIAISNNTFRDFTVPLQPSGIGSDMILENSVISGNTFRNFWIGGYSSTTSNPNDNNQSAVGIQIGAGLDNTNIVGNTFDEMENDGLHVFWQGMIGNDGGFTGSNVSISYNTFTRVHRIAVELQGTGSWPNGCPGGCTGRVPVAGLAVKGNYVHLPAWPYWNTYAYSLVEGASGSNDVFLNNTAIAEPGAGSGGPAYGIETPCCSTGQLIQGNVIASSLPNNRGWNAAIQNYAPGSSLNKNINNLLCGAPSGSGKIANNGAHTDTANLTGDTCPAGVTPPASSIVATFTSSNNQSFPSGGSGTWSLAVVSNLSVKYVQFFIDGLTTPAVTQELQDVNHSFAQDRKWLYHAVINTSSLSAGKHRLIATATDVAGASQGVSATFIVGHAEASGTQVTRAISRSELTPR